MVSKWIATKFVADKITVELDKSRTFPIVLTVPQKSDESLFYIQLNKAETEELVKALTYMLKHL